MTWILPSVRLPAGGKVRSVPMPGSVNDEKRKVEFLRHYHRAYYHAKRKPLKQSRTPAQVARRNAQQIVRYQRHLERQRANARARYWKHRDKYAAAARQRARTRRAK